MLFDLFHSLGKRHSNNQQTVPRLRGSEFLVTSTPDLWEGYSNLYNKPVAALPRSSAIGDLESVNNSRSPSPMDVGHSSFPPPPTLADILRMEPEFSLSEAARRAGCVHSNPSIVHGVDPDDLKTLLKAECLQKCNKNVVATNDDEESPWFHVVVEDSPSGVASDFTDSELSSSGSLQSSNSIQIPTGAETGHNVKALTAAQEETFIAGANLMAPWISSLLFKIFLKGKNWSNGGHFQQTDDERIRTESLIRLVIITAHVSERTALLALWYTSRFPVGMAADLKESMIGDFDISVLMFQTFVTGLNFARKWMWDEECNIKYWHKVSMLPKKRLNQLEMAALKAVDYNLTIKNQDWYNFLLCARRYHVSLGRISRIDDDGSSHFAMSRVYDYLLEESRASTPPAPKERYNAILESISGPIAQRAVINPPARWCPEEDPIIPRAPREVNHAPGSFWFLNANVKPRTTIKFGSRGALYDRSLNPVWSNF